MGQDGYRPWLPGVAAAGLQLRAAPELVAQICASRKLLEKSAENPDIMRKTALGEAMLKDIPGEAPRRGDVRRGDKIMSPEEVRRFLSSAQCGRTATVGPDGYPYVVPNLFVWMEERIFLHTARYRGHFLANVEFCDRVCFETDQPGETFPYGPVECDTSIAFRSVVIFGRIGLIPDLATRERFFAAFMAKYAPQDSWGRPKGTFPRIESTLLYAITPEIMTGKQTPLPAADKRWRRAGLAADAIS